MGRLSVAMLARLGIAVLALVAGCGGGDDGGLASVTPPVIVEADAGTSRDASIVADGAVGSDASVAVDAASPIADASLIGDGAAAPDAGVTTDAGRADAGVTTDAGRADAGSGATDAGSGATDAGARLDAGASLDAGAPPGSLGCGASVSYTRITHNLTTSDLVAVDFAPDGTFALAAARSGVVLRYRTQERDLTLVGTAASTSFTSVRFLANGDAVLGGSCAALPSTGATSGPCLYRYAAATGALTRLVPSQTVNGTTFTALGANAAGTSLLGTTFANNVLSLLTFDGALGILTYAANFATTTGPTGVAWGRMTGRDVALVSGGTNGSEILMYDPSAPQATRVVRVNSSYSNLAAVAARPGAEEFFLCDWSRNFVRYDGVLAAVQSPFYSCNGLAFSSDGASALFVGRPRGTPLLGSVALYRGAPGAFAAANVTDVSVPAFDANPYQADTNAHLLAAAWRPGACEGLIVGARGNGPNVYGMVIRFALP